MPTYRGPDFLTTFEQADIKTDLSNLVADGQVGSATITCSRLVIAASGSATINQTTGAITSPYTDKNVTAIVGIPGDADATKAGVTLKSTDRKFLIDYSDLGYEPIANDQVIYAGVTFEVVKSWYHAPTNVVVVYCAVLGGKS